MKDSIEEIKDNWKDQITRICLTVEKLDERQDRHSSKNESNFNILFKKVEELKDKIHSVEINSIKEDGAIKLKLVALMAGISSVIYLIGDAFKAALHLPQK